MKFFKYILFIIIFLELSCNSVNRKLEPIPNKYFPETIKAIVSTDLTEIKINRKWNQDSYLKPSSLNSYSIFVNNEDFKIYLRDKFQEKLAESNLIKEDKVTVEVNLINVSYDIDKDFGISFPSETITSSLNVKAVIFIYDQRREILYENVPMTYRRSLGNPSGLWASSTGLFGMTHLKLGYSGLAASVVTAIVYYFDAKKDNIERYLEEDLNRYCYFLRDKLEEIKNEKNSKKF